jgi:predicted AAA+ superfamily ATPase
MFLIIRRLPMDINLKDALIDSNPWWKGGFLDIAVKNREIYAQIEPYVGKRQIVGIYGLRRTGKSYLLYHLIKKILEKEEPRSILYFSFDAFGQASLLEILKTAEETTGTRAKFIFLDEVQKLDNWAEHVKRVYDMKGAKIFVSGSESLFLKKTSRESLGGRIFEFEMQVLSFGEYLLFRGIESDELHSDEIKRALSHYLLIGGFPELVEEKDPFFIRKYLTEAIVEKALFREIPGRFGIEDPSILERLVSIITDNPGLLIDKNSLASELGVFRTTVSKYLFYLESSFLIRSLHNYSRNASTSEKKLKKYYPGFLPLGIGRKGDPEYLGKVAETACVLKSGARFFWRSPQKDEVDIVLTNPLRPVEVKYREQPQAPGIAKFNHRFQTKGGLVITKDVEKRENGLDYVPLWKWLLEKNI